MHFRAVVADGCIPGLDRGASRVSLFRDDAGNSLKDAGGEPLGRWPHVSNDGRYCVFEKVRCVPAAFDEKVTVGL